MADQASIRMVTGGGEPPVEQQQPAAEVSHDPLPPQETEATLGGSALQSPSAEQIVEATGGSLADRMRARFQNIKGTEEFPVPGWELEDGTPGLILVARTFGDRKAWDKQVSNEAFIARSTHELYYVNDDGSRELIEGGWGPALAQTLGVTAQKATDLVAIVISKPDPAHPGQRIPNVAGIGALATKLVAWADTGKRGAEEDLGE